MVKRIILVCIIGLTCVLIGKSEVVVRDEIPVIERHFIFDGNVTEDYRPLNSLDSYELPPYDEKHPYWVRSKHGEISFIYFEFDEDKESYIAPRFPEGFSLEEYYANCPFAEVNEDPYKEETKNDSYTEKDLITEESIHTDFFGITLPKGWIRNVYLTEEIEGETHIYKFLAKDCADACEDILFGTLLSVSVSKNEEDIINLYSMTGGYRFSSNGVYALASLPTDIEFTDETQEVYMRLQDELMNEIGDEMTGLKKLFSCE